MTKTSRARVFTGVILAAGLLLGPVVAQAADVNSEIKAAGQHAGFAAKAGTIDMVHTHLHHVVNCLVGPNGDGFDAKALNPCKGMGNGAIPDATDMGMKDTLNSALKTAQQGISATSLSEAQADAKTVGEALAKAGKAGNM